MRENYAMLRLLGLSLLFLTVAGPAVAHPGHVESGFLHPLTGPDHFLAMVGAGMWAAFLASRKPAAAFWVPAAFMLMMAFGAAAGFAGIKLPFPEAGVLAPVFMPGGLVLATVRLTGGAACSWPAESSSGCPAGRCISAFRASWHGSRFPCSGRGLSVGEKQGEAG